MSAQLTAVPAATLPIDPFEIAGMDPAERGRLYAALDLHCLQIAAAEEARRMALAGTYDPGIPTTAELERAKAFARSDAGRKGGSSDHSSPLAAGEKKQRERARKLFAVPEKTFDRALTAAAPDHVPSEESVIALAEGIKSRASSAKTGGSNEWYTPRWAEAVADTTDVDIFAELAGLAEVEPGVEADEVRAALEAVGAEGLLDEVAGWEGVF